MQAALSEPVQSGAPFKLDISGVLDRDTLVHDFYGSLPQKSKDKLIASQLLVVDLAGVERADTSGLAWLLNLVKDLNKTQVEVSFSNIPVKLVNLAALSGAETLLATAGD
jgi:phospholipid transport system transporter-binding protein